MMRRFVMTVIAGMVLILALFIRIVGIGGSNPQRDQMLKQDPDIRSSLFHEREAGSFFKSANRDNKSSQSTLAAPQMEKVKTSDAVTEHVLKTFYHNGVVSSEWPFVAGELHGIAKAHYQNSVVWREWPFRENRLEGTVRTYYPNGTLWMTTPYQDGLKQGAAKIYYPNGTIWVESQYARGRLLKNHAVYSEVTQKTKITETQNVFTAESADVFQKMSGTAVTLDRSDLDVVQTRFADDSVSSQWMFQAKQLNGVSQLFHPNGALWQEMHFLAGEPDGRWNTFYFKGSVWEAIVYREGLANDTHRIYYPDQKVWVEFEYEDGKLKEIPRAYSQSGKLFQEASEVKGESELVVEITTEDEVSSPEIVEVSSELMFNE